MVIGVQPLTFEKSLKWELTPLVYKGVQFEPLIPSNVMDYFESSTIQRDELLLLKMCNADLYKVIKETWKGEWLRQQADWAFEEDEYQ